MIGRRFQPDRGEDPNRNMTPDAREVRRRVDEATRGLEEVKRELDNLEGNCTHNYKEIYDPIYHEAYTIPGDPPGTMGVDWRGPVEVPAETVKRWRRECTLCGKVEYTTNVTEEKIEHPTWPNDRRRRW